jgi:glycosyltransferase involved in cell wall biosynthesis
MSADVVFVSYRAAKPDGDGGNHRTYQIVADLYAEFGRDRVQVLTIEDWLTRPEFASARTTRPVRLRHLPARLRHRLARMTENPYRLLSREGWSHSAKFGTRGVLSREFLETYTRSVGPERRFDLCVVDHPMLEAIRSINAQLGIPTVIAPQNLESLDVGRVQLASTLSLQKATVDLANELRAYARYADRWAISKVECAVISGVGMSCQLYPYVPVGEVRAKLRRTAEQRARRAPDRRLFLLLGTANHAPTRRSLEWFLQRAREEGLPGGACVALVGSRVHELLPHGASIPGVQLLGRLSDDDLADLTVRSAAALVPQRMGFGAVTRIAELACAGVPVLTFPHASYAIDVPPGVHVLANDSWECLVDGMRQAMEHPWSVDPDAYGAWETTQPRPLGRSVRQLIT